MKKFTLSILLGLMSCLLLSSLSAKDQASGKNTSPRFGIYEAVTINRSVVNDVKIDKENNLFLQLMPDHKEKEIVVKISTAYFDQYRAWWHGEIELVSPANAGKAVNGWTDRVQTESNFVEYWMDGEVFLHLKRIDRGL